MQYHTSEQMLSLSHLFIKGIYRHALSKSGRTSSKRIPELPTVIMDQLGIQFDLYARCCFAFIVNHIYNIKILNVHTLSALFACLIQWLYPIFLNIELQRVLYFTAISNYLMAMYIKLNTVQTLLVVCSLFRCFRSPV